MTTPNYEIVVFHHAQGLTPGVLAFADRLRTAGYTVHTLDLYEGHAFDDLTDGIGYAQRTGFDVIGERARAAADALAAPGLVYIGFSLGGMPAQELAQTQPNARGALLFHSCIPLGEFGDTWPRGVPVQVHGMEADPLFTEPDGDLAAARALVASTGDGELFLYPATSTFLPTARCRRTTRPRPRCCWNGRWTSWLGSLVDSDRWLISRLG